MDLFGEDTLMPKFAVGDSVYSIDYVWDSEKVQCEECKGEGSIDGKECPICGGAGLLFRMLDTYSWRVDTTAWPVGKVHLRGTKFYYEFRIEPILQEDIDVLGEDCFIEVPEDELFTHLDEAYRTCEERNRSGQMPTDWGLTGDEFE